MSNQSLSGVYPALMITKLIAGNPVACFRPAKRDPHCRKTPGRTKWRDLSCTKSLGKPKVDLSAVFLLYC